MPISVVCPGCKARFGVNEKFAGKQGPCPKCKAVIKIPLATEEVKIHAPEPEGPVDSKGRSVLKPVLREAVVFSPVLALAIVGATLAVFVAAFAGRNFSSTGQLPLWAAGLLLPAVAAPIAVGGYSILREAELEPYRGRPLWLRALLCGLVYSVLWGAFYLVYLYLPGLFGGHFVWLFVIPPMLGVGTAAAYSLLDLDFGAAALHYTMFLIVSILLGLAAGYPGIWTLVKETQQLAR